MRTKKNCLLAGFRKDGCANCDRFCAHRITLQGLSGDSGRLGNTGLPADYRGITLANSPVRESQPEIYTALDRYAESFRRIYDEKNERIKSLYLWSESPGTGKTTTASALISEWIARDYLGAIKRGEQPRQFSAYFLDVNAWQELYTGFTRPSIPQEIAERSSRPYYAQMERARTAPFAVLDDLGVRDATDGFRQDLHAVINHRVTNGLPTVYTSNLPIEDMATVFDARLYDRIRDQCGEIHFEGESKRGMR